MTLDHLNAVFTGLTYFAAGMCLGVVVRLLGPTYHTKVTAPRWVILFFGVCSGVLLWRGLTILFPGRLVDVTGISLVAPVTALTVLGLCLFILDFIMGDRSPPPLFSRYFSWAIRRGAGEEDLVKAAFSLPPAIHNAAPPEAQINRCSRRARLIVLSGGAAAILSLLGVLAVNAG